ncbi:MAG: outer membrane protein assembly factor BamE [Alphaproteobacteria bacterium]|nr:outer membrane protein assembly factor BamE [Alphaproteobacteria bacterium]
MSIRNLLFLFALLVMPACSSDLFLDHNGNMPEEGYLKQLHVGQTKEEVYQTLGAPSLVTGLSDDHWIYMESTIRRIAFMKPTELDRNIIAVTFADNKVSKIDKRTLDDANNISIDSDETKPADRELGFFRKYFGGVGQYQMFGDGKQNKDM